MPDIPKHAVVRGGQGRSVESVERDAKALSCIGWAAALLVAARLLWSEMGG